MARRNPTRLAEKLLRIRTELGYSQRGLIKAMRLDHGLSQTEISMFESGKRIPNLIVLRSYGKLAGVWTDFLIEDGWDLLTFPGKMNKKDKN